MWLPEDMMLSASDLSQGGILILLFAVTELEGLPLADEPACGTGYYLNKTCTPCSICAKGYGVQTPCQGNSDTVCEPCIDGHFSKLTPDNRYCTRCSDCSALNKEVGSECTSERDISCGKCSSGYFVQVDSQGSTQCSKCSSCPPGRAASRWYECRDMPDDQQCAPGPYDMDAVNPVTPLSQILQWDIIVSQIASNQTVFIPILTPESPTEEMPVFETVVWIVSVIFTSITLFVFCGAVVSLCRRTCRRRLQ